MIIRHVPEDQALEVGWDEVRARRLARSSLTPRAPSDQLVEVAGAVCGVHAQVQASAELQLAARVEGLVQADVRSALWEQRALVKAWTVRGTLHLHPASELPLWFAARRAVLRSADKGLAAWRDPSGVLHPAIGADEVEAVRAAVWEVLDGRCLLRDELAEEVVTRVGGAAGERLRSGFAFFLGELCQGPPQGTRITLVRPDQWIDGWREVIDEDEALREVCRRFLRTYGPARPSDFCEWFASAAFKVADARMLFDGLAAELTIQGLVDHAAFASVPGAEADALSDMTFSGAPLRVYLGFVTIPDGGGQAFAMVALYDDRRVEVRVLRGGTQPLYGIYALAEDP